MAYFIVFLLSLLSFLPSLAQERPRIAVVEVKASRVSKDISSYVHNLLEEKLSRSGKFSLVERSHLKEVIEEVSFQQSGITDAETITEIGKHLNVEKLFFAQVHHLRPDYKLTVKIIDVATNQIDRIEEQNLGSKNPAIKAATFKLAQRLIQTASLLAPVEMVLLPAGKFLMGSNAGLPDEQPPHQVSISAFYLDRYEVSQIAYQTFLEARGKGQSSLPNPERAATMVSWTAAADYCQQLGKRLPTEAEWEYAARSAEGRIYPWGNAPPTRSQAHYLGGHSKGPFEVDSLPQSATPEGLFHLAGNVAEWVQDWWDHGYYATSPAADPSGPAEGDYKVVRGGSWSQPADELRTTARAYHSMDRGSGYIGFRCAKSAEANARH